MKRIYRYVFCSLLFAATLPAIADDYATIEMSGTDTSGSNLETLVKYLGNLGGNLGYNLATDVDTNSIMDTLINYSSNLSNSAASSFQKVFQQYAYFTFFGAMPVNSINSPTYQNFTENNYAQLNAWANATFPSYASNSSSMPSVNPNIDQINPQTDPVNQAVLNIIGIPDATMCTNGPSTSCAVSSSGCISQTSVMEYILSDIMSDGTLPGTNAIYSWTTNQKSLGALNTNNLVSPLVYSASSSGSNNNSSSDKNNTAGLPSSNQEQQASNFIRYAIGTLSETPTISWDDYNTLWTTAYPDPSNSTTLGCNANNYSSVLDARNKLETYFTGMRVFAARSSVAISNLYSIFSKRIKQTQQGANNNNSSSQALSEFQMATWRLNNPQNDINNQWVDQINKASSATVQKEIAVLLSEINYQLYLNRQQQERLLLTNSMILLQNLSTGKPTPPSPSSSSNGG